MNIVSTENAVSISIKNEKEIDKIIPKAWASIDAEGGEISYITVGQIDYKVHKFTTTGTSSFVVHSTGTDGLVEYLIVVRLIDKVYPIKCDVSCK